MKIKIFFKGSSPTEVSGCCRLFIYFNFFRPELSCKKCKMGAWLTHGQELTHELSAPGLPRDFSLHTCSFATEASLIMGQNGRREGQTPETRYAASSRQSIRTFFTRSQGSSRGSNIAPSNNLHAPSSSAHTADDTYQNR